MQQVRYVETKNPILRPKGDFWRMNIIPKYVLCTALERIDEIIYFYFYFKYPPCPVPRVRNTREQTGGAGR